jgi:NAD(P)H-hydrate repair Nnr-like enzyme with NAD(P)H-hydrate dehydratase domain
MRRSPRDERARAADGRTAADHAAAPSDGGRGKDSRGRVLIVGGGVETPGAALLAGHAALRSGAGKLQIATVRSLAPNLAVAMPESARHRAEETDGGGLTPGSAEALAKRIERCDALLLGPGLPDDEATADLTARVLSALKPDGPAILLDAGALSGLADQAGALRA